MKSPVVWILLWAGTLAGAWYLGSEGVIGGSSGGTSPEVTARESELRKEVEDLKAELLQRGPTLTGAEPSAQPETIAGEETAVVAPEPEFKPVHEFSLEGVNTPEEAVAHFLAYGKTMMSMGREGHLKFYEQINSWAEDKEFQRRIEQLFGRGERAIRHMVPVMQAALDQREEIADMQETILETMLENPRYFDDKSKDPLEVFTEGLGYLLPAVVSEERLAKWSGYVKGILAQPEEGQSVAVRENRRELERLLRAWIPQMDPDEIMKMLEGGVSPDEALAMLQQLPPDAMDKVDVGKYLAPKVVTGDWQAIRLLSRFRLSATSLASLDAEMLANAGNPQIRKWTLREYGRATGRRAWPAIRDFAEKGMRSAHAATRDKFADLALVSQPPADAEWGRWALDTFEFSENVRRRYKATWKLE